MIMSRVLRRDWCGALVEREAAEIALPPEDIVEQAAGFDEFVDHLPFARRPSEWNGISNGTELSQNGGNAQKSTAAAAAVGNPGTLSTGICAAQMSLRMTGVRANFRVDWGAACVPIRRANDRGPPPPGWLDSFCHTFSFASYFDPKHMGFRSLRVGDDNHVMSGQGFGSHGHRDMDTALTSWKSRLAHKDSMGGEHVIGPNTDGDQC